MSCLSRRLNGYMDLSEAESAFISTLEEEPVQIAAGDVLPVGPDGERLGVIDDGWAVAVDHGAGHPRITRIFVPGEVVGLAEIGHDAPDQDLKMQSAGTFCPFPKARLGTLLSERPRLSALFLAILGVEQLTLRRRFAAATRLPAEARLIHLLLDLRARLALPQVGSGNRFAVPMTQGEIGQAIGASPITVNKCLRGLIERGAVEVERPYFRLHDRDVLERDAGFVNGYERIDTSWFPKG